mmetsp:Transcript_10879/g.16569  ORF Transcript_10879/g.16569 Transcript_10879/m.16569 type:complete len:410 (+) Transcript_10879:126-1355(+)|eukprot:CAMPEP_0185037902 /NCGR_PEP_ID=MMETSP1103-20130426/32922_1 /TAXON_ID=36769 /ORGANISM="Paraphysomonas bandaiensis, Strain Caron Lab Isolate" /LENGTH=409 /DNA_ID=CAMNT_0027576095 /DNA_START=42 /DNA_END=1271 /DNA_ORIENTATION=-
MSSLLHLSVAHVLLLLQLLSLSTAFLNKPYKINKLLYDDESIVLFDSEEKVQAISADPRFNDFMFLIWVIRDYGRPDNIFMTTFERLLEFTRGSNCIHAVIEISNNDYSSILESVVRKIPDNSVFTLNGNAMQYDICNLAHMRKMHGFKPPVVFHLNQGIGSYSPPVVSGMHPNGTHCYNSEFREVYSQYTYVFRSFYYAEWYGLSHYVPIGPAFARHTRYHVQSEGILSADERDYWCLFSGRTKYIYETRHQVQRLDMIEAMEQQQYSLEGNSNRTCRTSTGEQNEFTHTMDHEEYIRTMGRTVFAPCPAGNNPETFRHYEAMALGAVPLIVRVPFPEEDFMQAWIGYPGPVFESWKEALLFVSSVSISEVKEIQRDVISWYYMYMAAHRENITNTLLSLVGRVVVTD